jgi:exonuclease III
MSWNIQSKNSTTLGNKFAIERFEKIVRNHDIVCLQETRSNVELKDYVVFNSIRKNSQRSGGGVSVLVRKKFSRNVTPFYCKNLSDVMAIKISHKMIDRP